MTLVDGLNKHFFSLHVPLHFNFFTVVAQNKQILLNVSAQ